MGWRLDDNERGAFNYLFGGVALVLVARGVLYAIDLIGARPSAEEEGLSVFQHGYLLSGKGLTVVATAADRLERIAFAVVLSVCAAILIAALAAVIARSLHRSPGRAALRVARVALVLLLGWSIYAALFVPVRSARIEERTLVVREYPCALREIPLPFITIEERFTLDDVSRIEAVHTEAVRGCDGHVIVQVIDQQETVIPIAERGGLCATDEVGALREASALAAALERELH
jgi:hypothetical protein